MFKLLVERGVAEGISLLGKESARIKAALKSLADNPFPDGKDKKMLKGTRYTVYRLRIGKYRAFYLIDFDKEEIKVTEFLTAEQAHRKYGRL